MTIKNLSSHPSIRILPPVLVSQIAAGEVIERPASAVKELVENAIDAGATRVEILIEGAGKSLIRVEDNGCGMSPEELELCVERHATSKLKDEDLFNILTFGFRGEALGSIASVSRMRLWSRKPTAEHGYCLNVEAGAKFPLQPIACNPGTVIEIRDLFYSTPARLKFIKSDNTELAAIVEQIEKIAIAHPHVALKLQHGTSNGVRTLLDLQSIDSNNLNHRLINIIGNDFVENCTNFDFQRDYVKVHGYCAAPTFNRATANYQYLFVNHRPVKDRLVLAAIRSAYQDFLARERYPVAIIFIEVPPAQVDVNVHPAKAEVKFVDSSLIRSAIVAGLRQGLMKISSLATTTTAQQAANFMRSSNDNAFADILRNNENADIFTLPKGQAARQGYEPGYAINLGIEETKIQENLPPQKINMPAAVEPPASPQPLPQSLTLEDDPLSKPLGNARVQIHGTYIIAETIDGMVIVDQHAAHERLVYENIKRNIDRAARQALLVPEVIQMRPHLCRYLLDASADLQRLGLVCESFGDSTIVVREVPAMLSQCNVKLLVEDIAAELQDQGKSETIENKIDTICSTMACHGSIRAGRALNQTEMNQLLRQMEECPVSGQCNHGRPTYVKLKKYEIEKLFGRKM